MYFSGHGESEKGGWVCYSNDGVSDETISFDDALEAVKEGGFKGKLSIIVDSCYSGHWCHVAKKSMEKDMDINTNRLPYMYEIDIYASAERHHTV